MASPLGTAWIGNDVRRVIDDLLPVVPISLHRPHLAAETQPPCHSIQHSLAVRRECGVVGEWRCIHSPCAHIMHIDQKYCGFIGWNVWATGAVGWSELLGGHWQLIPLAQAAASETPPAHPLNPPGQAVENGQISGIALGAFDGASVPIVPL